LAALIGLLAVVAISPSVAAEPQHKTAPSLVGARPAEPLPLPGREQAKPAAQPPKTAQRGREARPRRRKARAGGINPCMTPDPGWGIYDRWSRRVSMGQMLAPQRGGLTRGGGFDLIVHFHGHFPIRKEFVKAARGQVLVAIDLGIGSGAYQSAFASPRVFEKLLESVKKEMARRSGRKKTYVRKLALSSWSAGYGAVSQILQQKAGKKVDALILLDSVHSGYGPGGEVETAQLEPFLKFARKARSGRKLMFQSHSSITPPGYASTQEVSRVMVKKLGGKLRKSRRSDVLGLKLFERYDRRGYHVRGYRGDDKPDHCAHLGLMKDVLKVHINPRWRTPRGKRGRPVNRKALARAKRSGGVHTVSKGEHLGGIARSYGTTVAALREANGLRRGKPIRIGQELAIPTAGGKKQARSRKASTRGGKTHRVQSGQSLGRIAKRYRVTVAALCKANGIDRRKPIRPGQELTIPQSR
jgi:LysM repeat protein